MLVRGIPDEDTMRNIIDHVSVGRYEGNVEPVRLDRVNGKTLCVTLRVHDTHGPGARRAVTRNGRRGRHLMNACWHVNRDVMLAVFAVNPDARITSVIADYRGFDSFMHQYLDTGARDIGSTMENTAYIKLCDCAIYSQTGVDIAVEQATYAMKVELRAMQERLAEFQALDTALIHAGLTGTKLDLPALQKVVRKRRKKAA